jgi:hypothetical protein
MFCCILLALPESPWVPVHRLTVDPAVIRAANSNLSSERLNMRLGYERFYVTPHTVEEMQCRVCGTKCHVKREVHGPHEFVTAATSVHDVWDVFTCPHRGKAWHDKAVDLAVAIDETPSKRVAALMRMDLEDLLKENGVL